jgi:hypothetical protein
VSDHESPSIRLDLGGGVRSMEISHSRGEEPEPADEQEAALTRAMVAEAIEAYEEQPAGYVWPARARKPV